MKRCFKCGKKKPLSEFYPHPAMADGYLGKCKPCARVDAREARQRRPDYYRAYDRKRGRTEKRKELNRQRAKRPENRRRMAIKNRGRRLREPEKYKARTAVNNAIRDGKLIRQPCEKCGAKGQAHHEDYSKPLDVRWLCENHHKERHRQYE